MHYLQLNQLFVTDGVGCSPREEAGGERDIMVETVIVIEAEPREAYRPISRYRQWVSAY